MEYLPLGRIAALVPEFSVNDLPLGRTLMMMMQLGTNHHFQIFCFLLQAVPEYM